jgi:hypothetical protein
VTGVSESQSTFDLYDTLWFCARLAAPNGKNSETNCLVETRQLCRANWPCPPALAQGNFLVVVPVHTGAQHTVNNTGYNGHLQPRLRRHTPNSINEHTLHSNNSARPPTEIGRSQSRNTNAQIPKRPRVSTLLWAVPRWAGIHVAALKFTGTRDSQLCS